MRMQMLVMQDAMSHTMFGYSSGYREAHRCRICRQAGSHFVGSRDNHGRDDIPIPMIQAVAGDEYCIFYHNGLCELHDKGLKPTEGRLSHHSTRLDNFKASKSISWNVAKEWLSEENAEVIERVADKFSRNLKTIEQ